MNAIWSMDTVVKTVFFVLEYWIFFYSLYPRRPGKIAVDSAILCIMGFLLTVGIFDVNSFFKAVLYDFALIFLCSTILVAEVRLQPNYAAYISTIFNLCRGVWNRQKTIVLFPQAVVLPIPVHYLIRELVGIVILLVLKRFFVKIEKDRELSGLELLAGTFPQYAMYLSSFAIFFYIYVFSGIESAEGQRMFSLTGFFLGMARLVSVAVQEAYFANTKARTDLVFAQEQLQRQNEQFIRERANDERLKSVYHDMANHLTLLENMTSEESVRAYVRALKEETDEALAQVDTGNETLNLLLSQESRKCAENGITLEAAVYFPHSAFLTPMEICTLFSNPIDNAMEALLATQTEDRTIRVNGKEEHNCFIARFENAFSGTLKEGLKTSKTDGLHGYGLKNVRSVLEAHDGTMQIRTQDNRFVLTMLVPLSSD